MLRAASVRSRLLALFGLAVLPAVALSAAFTWQGYRTIKLTTAKFQRLAVASLAAQVGGDLTGLNVLGRALLATMDGDDARDCADLRRQTEPGRDGRVAAYAYFRDGALVCAAGDAGALAGFPAPPVRPAGEEPAGPTALTSDGDAPLLGLFSWGPHGRALLTVVAPSHLENKVLRAWTRGGHFIVTDARNRPLAGMASLAGDPPADWLPRDPATFAAAHEDLVDAPSRDGHALTYAAATVTPGVASVFSGLRAVRFGAAEQQLALGLAAPLLVFAIVMAVTWLAIDRLFLQWVRRLSKTAIRLSYGDFNVRAALPPAAPRELRQFADAFDQMTEVLAARTRELATVANQRQALLKELHHRVKNNFQVIVSFISLSRRQSSGEAQEALGLSECRVQAMAAAYKQALAEGDITSAALGPLAAEVPAHVEQCSGAPPQTLSRRVDPAVEAECYLELDRAIPLALLLVETLWPVLARPGAARPAAHLELAREGGGVRVRLWDLRDGAAAPETPEETLARRLSGRMRQAFITQLDAQQAPPPAHAGPAGATCVLSVVIPTAREPHAG
ncbi:sensor histidine kinase [Camelimonas abortus]|uniref:histidine kinase n=1 Tax=Camelimonas abortus TaxID=1017184 RepID=A0ABV7LC25_9HYPH